MKELKCNLAVKTAAFLLLVVCTMLTVLSSVVIAGNVVNDWYSRSKETVELDLYKKTAAFAASEIMESLPYTDGDANTGARLDLTALKNMGEIIYGEENKINFGYTLYTSAEEGGKETPVKQVNAEMKDDYAYDIESFYHQNERIEIYLAELTSEGLPETVYSNYNLYHRLYQYRVPATIIGIASLLIAICLLVFLTYAVGSKNERTNQAIRKVPLDVLLAVCMGPALLLGFLTVEELISYYNLDRSIAAVVIGSLGIAAIAEGFFLFFAARVKLGEWWKSTAVYQILHWLGKVAKRLADLARNIPLVWRTALIMGGIILANIILVPKMYYSSQAVWLWIIGTFAFSVCVIYIAIGMKRLQEGAKHLADGDLSYQIEKQGLRWELAEHANNLNSIGSGMAKALEERMKSERFKAELITNVSHDIKTPLTSIINYVDFLKSEELENDKAKEYIEVLDRQSKRLKKLTDDLVEASKAATGNVKMEMAPCQVGILMTQTMGEYKEKAEANDLNFIMRLPEEELEIMADGRRLWRVFDNLLGNICKYSQPGTRVYLTLEEKKNKAVITYRNTSKYELNITEDELVERFVRGDSSRHTEGSGLGLSIAQNLVQLQGGEFHIFIDGDLFKVVIEFELLT